MRKREPRRRTLISARMRCGDTWTDVSIRNISSRGLQLETEGPPPPGTYVEVRRGTNVMVGRTMWQSGRRFGVSTQDKLNIPAIIAPPTDTRAAAAGEQVERRTDTRRRMSPAERAETSRRIASTFQFVIVAGAGLAAAAAVASQVFSLLSRPLAAIGAHLLGAA